jgi:hypothetical protein
VQDSIIDYNKVYIDTTLEVAISLMNQVIAGKRINVAEYLDGKKYKLNK